MRRFILTFTLALAYLSACGGRTADRSKPAGVDAGAPGASSIDASSMAAFGTEAGSNNDSSDSGTCPFNCSEVDGPPDGGSWCESWPNFAECGNWLCHLTFECRGGPPPNCPESAPYLCSYSQGGTPCLWQCSAWSYVAPPGGACEGIDGTFACENTLDAGDASTSEAGDF